MSLVNTVIDFGFMSAVKRLRKAIYHILSLYHRMVSVLNNGWMEEKVGGYGIMVQGFCRTNLVSVLNFYDAWTIFQITLTSRSSGEMLEKAQYGSFGYERDYFKNYSIM
ncbi:hypothetical protein CEXT_64711 [Caerostris extrusa]|uniref:Uncharacterized protein n=1 Tax=Caerostris extrusa TaxID=172846 RepID=A0AAV4RM82_CAEEX|nr:hypothetical protein CEXT_64711 [Caerostris extrusa]